MAPTGRTIRPAAVSEVRDVAELLTEAATYVRDVHELPSWPVPFPEREVRRAIESEETHVVEQHGQIVATFNLVWDDPKFWGAQAPDAGYVHKVAVRRAFAHQGIGAYILTWVADRIRREGRHFVRLDCLAANRYLLNYYAGQGFRRVRDVRRGPPGEERNLALMERSLEDLGAPAPPGAEPRRRAP